jgi:hypothetical protein
MVALGVGAMFVTGWFVKKMAWAALRRGILNQHVLMEFGAFAGLIGGLLGIEVVPGSVELEVGVLHREPA